MKRSAKPRGSNRLFATAEAIARTSTAASCNLTAIIILATATLYFALGIHTQLDPRLSDAIARIGPWLLAYAGVLQLAGIGTAWAAARRLIPSAKTARRTFT